MTVRRSLGIRFKLIAIFVFIKVVPLVVLAWVAWSGIAILGESLQSKVSNLSRETQDVISQVSNLAVDNSIRALDLKSRENIERLSTDTARAVATFLYDRDDDIRIGVKSTAILFGDADRVITATLQCLVLLLLISCGRQFSLGWYYYSGIAIGAGIFGYQQWLIRDRSPTACLRAFMNNNLFGLAVFAGLAADFQFS